MDQPDDVKRQAPEQGRTSTSKRNRPNNQDAAEQIPIRQKPLEQGPAEGEQSPTIDAAEIGRAEVLDWLRSLGPTTHEDTYAHCTSKCVPDSAKWFLNSPHFTSWLRGHSKTLFCPGLAGSGKTMIATVAIQHLQANFENQNTKIAYLYCEQYGPSGLTGRALLAVLLTQLLETHSEIPDLIKELYPKRSVTADDLEEVLEYVALGSEAVFVVVDAIDQCSKASRETLLTTLRDLQSHSQVYLLATSRKEPSIEQIFANNARLDIQAATEDIECYLEAQISQRLNWLTSSKTIGEIKTKIIDSADGLFLLAKIAFELLPDTFTEEEIQTEIAFIQNLSRGPQAYTELYSRLLHKIGQQGVNSFYWSRNLLSWVFCNKTVFSVKQLQTALAIREGDRRLCEARIVAIPKICTFCAGLVTVSSQSELVLPVSSTAREYFEYHKPAWMAEGPLEIAGACLTYLQFDEFTSGPVGTLEHFKGRLSRYPLLSFAASHWADHVPGRDASLLDVAAAFLTNNALTASASQVMDSEDIGQGRYNLKHYTINNAPHGSHILASFGLDTMFQLLLNKLGGSWDILDEQDPKGDTPLTCAAIYENEGVVRLLLDDEDVNPTSRNLRGNTPFHEAVRHCQLPVIKAFLDCERVDHNARGDHERSALHLAVRSENEELVKFLIENGRDRFDFNARDRAQYTPLHEAANCKSSSIMEMLFAIGDGLVDLNAVDVDGWTALHHAAYYYTRSNGTVFFFLLGKLNVFNVYALANDGWSASEEFIRFFH